jgi:3-dehydroquinate dehydratase/shikimate dehydrogenase
MRIAVPISASEAQEVLVQARAALAAGADIIEFRTDYLQDLSSEMVSSLIEKIRGLGPDTALIVTCRDAREGGVHEYPAHLRTEILKTAIECNAEFIDCEFSNFCAGTVREALGSALKQHPKTRLILSAHQFSGPFPDLKQQYQDIRRSWPTAIPKLVYTAQHINDCFEAFDLLHQTEGDRIVLCMGQAGLISRVTACMFGGFLTFASLGEANATAPGQLTIGQLRDLIPPQGLDTHTQLFGIIADPVGHSLSPALHNACFRDSGFNGLYLPLLVQGGQAELADFLENLRARPWLGFRGFSVTLPHKQSALSYVQQQGGSIEPLVAKIGATNTLILSDDSSFMAYNTDYAGAMDAVMSSLNIGRRDLDGMSVAIVGAGGVSRAIVAGFRDAGAKVKIYNRTVAKAERLAEEFGCAFASIDALQDLSADLLINCTSIGMHPHVNATPVPGELLKRDMAVFDKI